MYTAEQSPGSISGKKKVYKSKSQLKILNRTETIDLTNYLLPTTYLVYDLIYDIAHETLILIEPF